jgi:hypothetical protein
MVEQITSDKKWYISILSGILFYIIASPQIYKKTGKIFYTLFDVKIQNRGKPNNLGLLIHAVIFVLITRFLMDFDKKIDL